MSHQPSTDLTAAIATQIASLIAGTNLFDSMVKGSDANIPVNCVFVWNTPGITPLRTMGEPNEIRQAIVQLRVRNSKSGTGLALAFEIFNALRGLAVATYLDVKSAASGPSNLGQDSDGAYYFSASFVMVYQE